MLLAAEEAGLDFLGVTDHNQVGHHAEYGRGGNGRPIVVPGVEVTTYRGHWNAWGTDRWWEFREPEAPAVERAMRDAAESGAVVSVNHPKPFGPPWEYEGITAMHAVEAWNGPWAGLNAASLAWWESLLERGLRVGAVGGSDTHILRGVDSDARHGRGPGTPTTWVEAGAAADTAGGPGAAAIVDAIRSGRTSVSASPSGPQLYLDRRGGSAEVAVRDGAGAVVVVVVDGRAVRASVVDETTEEEWRLPVPIPARARYVRAQLVDRTGEVVALTSPRFGGE
jgi:predicted metal-dependent phosphoesterase TrpH